MSAAPRPPATGYVTRFGVFTLDQGRGELSKHGVRVRLGGQPLQILCLLVERHGEIVTRDDLRARIWPHTFVDFDGALNTAMRRIRSALGDSAENPRYVETVPKLGYRFLAPVETSPQAPSQELVVLPAPMRKYPMLRAALLAFAAAGVLLAAVFLGRQLLRPVPRVVRYLQITSDGEPKNPPLVTDGVWLYYNVTTDSGIGIGQVAASGENAPTAIWPGFWLMDLSKSGAELLARDEESTHQADAAGPIWILPLPAGSPRKLGITGRDAVWSRDGASLAYANGSTIYVSRHDGSNSRPLVSVDGIPRDLRWSPDGSVLRFDVQVINRSDVSLWQVSNDGSHLRRLLGPDTVAGNWSPDGRYYLFGQGADLWALGGRAGQQPSPFTAGPIRFLSPAFTRDGKSLFAQGIVPRGQVVRWDPGSHQFLPYLRGISADGLVFSRDGQWVAYTSQPDANLWRSRVDGTQRLQLTFGSPEVMYPRWSPDGSQIAFTRRDPSKARGPYQVYLVSAAGGVARELAPGETDQAIPAWAPEGNLLAYGAAPWMHNWSPDSTAIHVYDFTTHSTSLLAGSEGLCAPKWSPDGRYIAAKTANARELQLWDRTSGKWSSLARVPDMIQYSAWSHDGKYVYFNLTNPPDIWRVRLADRVVEEVLRLRDFRVAFTGSYWFGLAPDDSLLLLRDTSVQEIYQLELR